MDNIRLFIGRICQEKKDSNTTPPLCPKALIRSEFYGRGYTSDQIKSAIKELKEQEEMREVDTIHGAAFILLL